MTSSSVTSSSVTSSSVTSSSSVASSSVLSPLLDKVRALSECSGSFYFHEPRERARSGGPDSPLVWVGVSPIEEERLHFSCLDTYSLQLCSSLTGSLALSPEEAVTRISEKRLWQSMSLLFVPDYCQSGDYGGAVHYLSNARELLRAFSGPECRELIGSYGSHGIAIDCRYLSPDLLESLESLESYPVLCEESLGELELELQSEAWESYLASDFRRELERLLCDVLSAHYEDGDDERAEKSVESLSEDQLWSLLSNAAEEANIYWEHEYNAMWISCREVAESLSEDQLLSLLIAQ